MGPGLAQRPRPTRAYEAACLPLPAQGVNPDAPRPRPGPAAIAKVPGSQDLTPPSIARRSAYALRRIDAAPVSRTPIRPYCTQHQTLARIGDLNGTLIKLTGKARPRASCADRQASVRISP